MNKIQQIQEILGVKPDGDWGPRSKAAFNLLFNIHSVKASSFADPEDIRRFAACKKLGKTDQACFKVGDNGVGKWGTPTTGDIPMCALPPEQWQGLPKPNKTPVSVKIGSKTVVCLLTDSMPHEANITNGAGIDLNFAALKAFGLTPPILVDATWAWAEQTA